MDNVKLSQANQVYINKETKVPQNNKNVTPTQQIEDSDDKLRKTLIALGTIAVAAITIGCIAKGKMTKVDAEDIDFRKAKGANNPLVTPKGKEELVELAGNASQSGIKPLNKNALENSAEIGFKGKNNAEITIEAPNDDKVLTDALEEQQEEIENLVNKKDIAGISEGQQEVDSKVVQKVESETPPLEQQKEINNIDFSQETDLKYGEYVFGCSSKDLIEEFGFYDSELKEKLMAKKNISLDSASKLADYTDKPYDMPLDFMIAVNEAHAKSGSAVIVDKIPQVFEGIDSAKISDVIDELGIRLKSKKINKFSIDGKNFTAEYKGSGNIGMVYKISDEAGNSVAVKYFHDPNLTGLQGLYAEIPIVREASKAGLKDAPEFFMANPYSRYITADETGICGGVPKGGWHMVEYIDEDTPLKSGDKGFFEWLREHGLYFGDFNSGTKKGNYVVDMGGVTAKKYSPDLVARGGQGLMTLLLRGYRKGETIDDVLLAMQKVDK